MARGPHPWLAPAVLVGSLAPAASMVMRARTGGLGDTIIDANEAALAQGVATGILFDGVTNESLANALQRTVSLYARRDAWSKMQVQGMTADFSWHQSGARYAELYAKLMRAA